ncbi:MAG: TonB-dependent receptor [Bacteroidota bacterium]
MKLIPLIFFLLICNPLLYAQQDSSFLLHEVNIVDYHIKNIEQSARIEVIDSSVATRISSSSLASLLNNHSSAFIKDNGGGRLATISIRGTSASENSISWNGLLLNTPTLGLYDLSLMPAFFIDKVSVQFGGNGSLNGSDAIGGAVTMASSPSFNKGLYIQLMNSIASFNDFEEGVKVSFSNSSLSIRSAIYRHDAENNYTVKQPGKSTSYKQPDAAFYTTGMQQEIAWLKKKELISFHFMLLDARHETPPLLSSSLKSSEQVQHDNQLRMVARWQHEENKFGSIVNVGLLDDRIHYTDEAILLDDFSKGESFQANAELHYRLKKSTFLFGFNQQYSRAYVNSSVGIYSQGYPSRHTNEETGIYINYLVTRKRFISQFSLRYDPSIEQDIPLVPAIGITYHITSSLNLKSNIAGVYRNPTLNDRYWAPGGNPSLKPERGHQADLFLNYSKEIKQLSSQVTAGIFYLYVLDYIQWLPGADNIYSPVNEEQIINRGAEFSIKEAYEKDKWRITFKAALQYTLATKADGDHEVDIFLFKLHVPENIPEFKNKNQLIYVPKLTWKINGEAGYRKTSLHITTGYTGYRYYTTDNNYWLNPFRVSTISLMQEVAFNRNRLYISGMISNPENNNYEVIAERPVAGIAYKLSLLFEFN